MSSSSTTTSILSQWTLKGRNYVVTGGSNGIGLATVKALLAHQASVLFCSRKPCTDLLESLKQDFSTATVLHVACDVSTVEGRRSLVEAAQTAFAQELHGLINNVGTNIRKPMTEQTPSEYQTMMKTNVDAAYFLCQDLVGMLESSATTGATIVNVSSAAGVQSSGTGAAYGMSKAALNQMTKILACEWAKRNIRVNAVTPWMTMYVTIQHTS